jgi:membrane protease YdiL (CAAX protease family)
MSTATTRPVGGTLPATLAASGGCALLLLRPWLAPPGVRQLPTIVALFAVLAAVAMCWPLARARATEPWPTLAIGVAAFTVGRAVGLGTPHVAFARHVVLLGSLAAVSEELFFRRFLYGALAAYGDRVAIAVTAVAFAIVHVTVWGVWALPLDLAAGLLLSWQRATTGTWAVPAVTHVVANLLAVL